MDAQADVVSFVTSLTSQFTKDEALAFYRQLLVLRHFDDRCVPLKLKDLIMDGFHPYVGQEAVAVGVCANLRPEDVVISNHRPQGHSLAKGSTVKSLYAEMLGRIGGVSDGLGGPMQWVDKEHNFYCGSIVGSGVTVAAGVGLAAQYLKQDHIACCFFGDGASNTGSFHEGLNLAAIWKLPVLYICENNQYGEAMPVKDFVPVARISQRVDGSPQRIHRHRGPTARPRGPDAEVRRTHRRNPVAGRAVKASWRSLHARGNPPCGFSLRRDERAARMGRPQGRFNRPKIEPDRESSCGR